MQRPHPPRTRLESDIVEAENAVRGFAERNKDVTVTVLRFANGLGPDLQTSHRDLLSLPAIPCILGFDPRYQFVHEDDIVGVLEHAVAHDLPGIYNVAGDGVLVLSEVASLLGRPLAPVLPPWGTGLATTGAARRRRADPGRDGPAAALRPRGWTTASSRPPGFSLRYTTREAVAKFAEDLRVRALRQGGGAPYRYEREVEEFLRYSPSVRRRGEPARDESAG